MKELNFEYNLNVDGAQTVYLVLKHQQNFLVLCLIIIMIGMIMDGTLGILYFILKQEKAEC